MVLKSLQELNSSFFEKNQTYEPRVDERRGSERCVDECCVDEQRADKHRIDEPLVEEHRVKAVLQAKPKVLISVIALLLLPVLLFTAVALNPNNFFGYSFFTVLSHSMYDEIPKGSLIVVKRTDPQSLNVGDNITFKRDRTTTVTHKVVEIHENYSDSGARGFRTMGVNNTNPDTGIVNADSVIGVVTFCIPGLGSVLAYIVDNIGLMCIVPGGIAAAVVVIKRVLLKRTKQSGHGDRRTGSLSCYIQTLCRHKREDKKVNLSPCLPKGEKSCPG